MLVSLFPGIADIISQFPSVFLQPERISGEQYGIHSDVWSLGISFMELALGRFPYPQIQKNQGSLMPLQLLQCIVDEDSPVLPVGEFSEPFVHFITQCMRKQPKERPAPEELMAVAQARMSFRQLFHHHQRCASAPDLAKPTLRLQGQ
uniref:mitogen-activated protein kinase kinase n=1 Tax=Sus scrofa TaxID=9823 RepID=A0A8D0NHW8_PIG